MPNFCKIPYCNSRSDVIDLENPKITFHYLPVSLRDRNRWIKIIKERCNYEVKKFFCICSLHFLEDCFNFVDEQKNKKFLRQGAIPTLFPPLPRDREYNINFQEIWIQNNDSHSENINDDSTLSDQNTIFFNTDHIIVDTGSEEQPRRNTKAITKSKRVIPRDPFEEVTDEIDTIPFEQRLEFERAKFCKKCKIRKDMQCERSVQTDVTGDNLANDFLDEDNSLDSYDWEKTKISPALRCQLQHEEILRYRKRIAILLNSRNELLKQVRRLESSEKYKNERTLTLVKVDHSYSLPPIGFCQVKTESIDL